jgi:acyl-CoA reductase-like NAD-dependent aldehyde dehydrogenase
VAPTSTTTADLESRSPTTGELVGSVQATPAGEVAAVVEEVAQVQPVWAQLKTADRGRYLRRAAQAIIDLTEEIVALISREQGKPRTEAYLMEVLPTIDALHWMADRGPSILADEKIPHPQLFLKTKRSSFTYDPLGVVAVIAPWNFPWTIPLQEVAMALMAGNGVVLKPASLTPLTGERIAEVFARAGVPEGIVRVVHGPGTGEALVESKGIAKVFFTGSVETGRGVGEACARAMKGSVLELGGKDPMIVLADADLQHAVDGALWAGFANAGQSCSGIERVYVVREVADRFVAGVVERARRLRVGNPADPDVEVGPMTSDEQWKTVGELVDDAVAAGAALECGGPIEVPGLSGAFYAPTVLTGVTHDMRIMREEIFGPVLPIMVVADEREAVRLANDSDFGLGASIWTQDRAKAERMAREVEAGMVWINDHMYSHGACQCSWGGIKESGLGRSHSKFGFYECVNVKLRAWEPSWTRDLWWQPYDEKLDRAVRAAGEYLYGREADRPRALRQGAVPLLSVARRMARDALRR